jgi:hypothetical protein
MVNTFDINYNALMTVSFLEEITCHKPVSDEDIQNLKDIGL